MKVAFLDRDGVINKEVGYLHQVEHFEYTDNCVEALKSLKSNGFSLIIVTNQAGIAKGLYSIEDYDSLTAWMVADLDRHGVNFTDILYCPHHPNGVIENFTVNCSCRKPLPGMFLKAQKSFGVDMKNSIVIGDKWTDIQAGRAAGVGRAFLVESGHPINKKACMDVEIVKDLFEVSKIISSEL